jgi:ketosteroid isomerase-like protein
MVSENLDLVRSIFAAWERGDFRAVDWAHPEIEFVTPDGPTHSTWRGRAAMAEGFRNFVAAWQGFTVEVEKYRELDDGRILVLVRHRGRGKTSGVELAEVVGGGRTFFK